MRQLSPERVDGLFRHFEAGRSIRGAARLTGVARGTAARWHAIWRGDGGQMGAFVVARCSAIASSRLRHEAQRRRISRAKLVGALLEAVAEPPFQA
jgi:hypothetical protein